MWFKVWDVLCSILLKDENLGTGVSQLEHTQVQEITVVQSRRNLSTQMDCVYLRRGLSRFVLGFDLEDRRGFGG